ARAAMINLHAGWLKKSGKVAPLPDNFAVEISPLFALDEEECKEKISPPLPLASPLYIEE
ncbi:MAG: UDPGP type 1 family protein, partial [Pseudomonadota bacterium]